MGRTERLCSLPEKKNEEDRKYPGVAVGGRAVRKGTNWELQSMACWNRPLLRGSLPLPVSYPVSPFPRVSPTDFLDKGVLF